MLEITLRSCLSEFNASKFIVYVSLLSFTILLALKLDGFLDASYLIIFAPLWTTNVIVLLGFFVGFVGFCMSPTARADTGSRVDFICMCLCVFEHLALLGFELMCCYKLEFLSDDLQQEFSWCFVFTPLFVESLLAMVISVYCIRHEKTFEFEMFFALNVVQFVFVSFKLDNALHWSWSVVFVPTWILLMLLVLCSTYSLILAVVWSPAFVDWTQQRRAQIYNAVCRLILSVPLVSFFVLLTSKLDVLKWMHEKPGQVPFVLVSVPLYIALILLIFMAFGNRNGNTWWFAMRKPFCNFVFDAFPFLREYANISYRIGVNEQHVERPSRGIGCEEPLFSNNGPTRSVSAMRIANQLWSIETPD